MLTTLKAYRPATVKASSPNSTRARRLKHVAMMALSMIGACQGLLRRGRVQNVADEHRAVGDRQLATLETGENRVLPIERLAELHRPLREAPAVRRHPRRKAAVAIAYHAVHGYGDRCDRVLYANREVRQHP